MGLPLYIDTAMVSTKDLLGDNYPDVDMEPLPHPATVSPILATIASYTEERLKQGLVYAEHTLRSNWLPVPPATTHCLSIYKSTLETLLKKDYADEEEKTELLHTVHFYERGIFANEFLSDPSSCEGDLTEDFMERFCDLRRYEFAVRYEEYVVPVFRRMNKQAPPQSSPRHFDQSMGWDDVWTDKCLDINLEQAAFSRWESRELDVKYEDVQTTLDIMDMCTSLGLSHTRTLASIRMYVNSNSHMHKSVAKLAERHLWQFLAQSLAEDLRDLPMVIPHHEREEIHVLQGIINAVIDQYFERSVADPEKHHLWTPRYRFEACPTEPREMRRRIVEHALVLCGGLARQRTVRAEGREGRSRERRVQELNWRTMIAAHRNAHVGLGRFYQEIADAVASVGTAGTWH